MSPNPQKSTAVRSASLWLGSAIVAVSVASLTVLAQNHAPTAPKATPKAPAHSAPAAATVRTTAPRRIELLFLGGENGEHSTQRATALFVPALAKEGINVSWADDVADLTTSNLNKYDVLMVYGDFDTITSAEEAAVEGYVNGGHGLVAIHSAADMFKTTPAWGKLIGAQL